MAIQRERELISSSVSIPENLPGISPRDIRKVMAFGFGSLFLNACAPSLARKLATANSTLAPNPTDTELPTKIRTVTQTSFPKEPTPKVWNLSLAERIKLMSSPDFLTELMAFQFNDKEYVGMYRKDRDIFKNNTCFGATTATIWNMLLLFKTGKNGDKTITDVYQEIDGKTFQDINGKHFGYVGWDDEVDFDGFPSALQLIMPQLVSKTEFLTPDLGGNHVARVFPKSNWPVALSGMQSICEDGGFAIIECYKHSARHISLATDVKEDGTATIVDTYTGIVQRMRLENYVDLIVDDIMAKSRGLQPGLFNIIGVMSN